MGFARDQRTSAEIEPSGYIAFEAPTGTNILDTPVVREQIIAQVAAYEGLDNECVRKKIDDRSVVLLQNHIGSSWLGIGSGLTTKINANVGTSVSRPDYRDVIRSARVAKDAGAHTLMDLSTVGLDGAADFAGGIRAVADETGLVLGSVPLYEAARRAMIRSRQTAIALLDGSEMLDCVASQAEAGSRFMAIHAAMNLETLAVWRKAPRNIVSKGGYLSAEYMLRTGHENPFFERFDDLLKILRQRGVCLNIGSALRSGSTRNNDAAQLAELRIAGELAERASAAGVQTVIEGPGHVPLSAVGEIVRYQQSVTRGRPFFILGFMTSDAFVGRDHIVSAIGAVEGIRHGVSWLCYITPGEHLRMPNENDVREGVMAARIAAHTGDCANNQPRALTIEASYNGKACLDIRAKKLYCTICGQDFCPIQRLHDLKSTVDVGVFDHD